MHFRAHGRRCAVDIVSWHLPISKQDALQALLQLGFLVVKADILSVADGLIGKTEYRRGARVCDAPSALDCSGFVKWLYAQRGIWLPRRSLHQFSVGEPVDTQHIEPGDLVFTGGNICPPHGPRESRVSHVGIVGKNNDVFHASPNVKGGVVRGSVRAWTAHTFWRGARRIVPTGTDIITLETPIHLDIETSDDVCWTLLERLDWT